MHTGLAVGAVVFSLKLNLIDMKFYQTSNVLIEDYI